MFPDVAFWLKEVGYDLDTLLPKVNFEGQIHPETNAQQESQMIPITSAFECAFDRDMNNFVDISTVPRSKVTSEGMMAGVARSFAPFQYIFSQGIVLSAKEGRVVVNVLDSANENLAILATTLLNNSHVVDLHFTKHGKDLHYFVKHTLEQAIENVKDLSLRTENLIQGINVSVHRHHETPETMKYVDIKLHSNHTVINLRYGTTVEHERQRILSHAQERAVENAWVVERELIQSKKRTINTWTKQEREELLSQGLVKGAQAHYIRDVKDFPELADDPKNIRFEPRGSR